MLRVQRLPLSVVQSAMHSYISSPKQTPQSRPHPSPTDVLSKFCFQGQSESDIWNQDVLTETHAAKNVYTKVQELHQTVDGSQTELQEDMHEKQEDERGAQPEDKEEKEDDSVRGTVLKDCPIDPHYLLHSQNPAECASVNSLTGFTNGFPQKGLLQNKHKIRVDFKVRLEFAMWAF